MNIRPATPDEIPAIIALERACPLAAHWNEAEYRLVFDPGATPRLLLVAEQSLLLGFVTARTLGPEWEIENVAVVAEARRRGLGTELVSAVLAAAKQRRAEAIFLEVRASNAPARRLYAHAGFVEIGHRPAYYSNPPEDAILYRRHLSDSPVSAP